MNEKLEQLSFEMFPYSWEHIDNNFLGQERDVNYEQRQKWLEGAKKIYNLALEDIRQKVEKKFIETALPEFAEVLVMIDNLTK